jgi:FKBP-type peptidyl-prolyl cis-trans isomerase
LFVFDGENAALKSVSNARKFELTVPLRKTSHLVTWFTDRPNRDAGHIPVKNFVGLWQQGGQDTFKSDPPNVAISFDDKTLIAKMTNPKIVKTKDGREVLVSTMTLVKSKSLTQIATGKKGLATHAKRAGANTHSGASTRIGSLRLFVDDVITSIGMTTTSSGLQYRDVSVGTGASPSSDSATVVVNYTGWLLDGTQFVAGSNVSIDLSGAIQGLQEGISSMRVGGQRQLIVPAGLAYGAAGTQNIPPNSTLVFDISLVSAS